MIVQNFHTPQILWLREDKMANYFELSKIKAKKFVTVSSRYSDSEVIYYTEKKLLTFPLYRKKSIQKDKRDKFTIISSGHEFGPDLTSNEFYGTPDFWWKIMEANDLKDIYQYKAGLSIKIPGAFF